MTIDLRRFNFERNLNDALVLVTGVLNALSSGKSLAFRSVETDTAPTSLVGYSNGDFIPKKTRGELGTGGSKYVLHGWDCVDVGGSLVWRERRTLTGN